MRAEISNEPVRNINSNSNLSKYKDVPSSIEARERSFLLFLTRFSKLNTVVENSSLAMNHRL